MENLIVVKRSGVEEGWNKDKIINSIAKAGLSMKEAEALSVIMEEWASKNEVEGKIMSAEIRDKIVELLKIIDPIVGNTYQTYKK